MMYVRSTDCKMEEVMLWMRSVT